jgi:hypothetical protein
MDIREGFLHNPEEGSLDVSAESAKVWRDIKIHLQPAALRKPVHIPSSRRAKAGLVKQRWVKQMRDRTCFIQALIRHLEAFREQCSFLIFIRRP